MAALNGGVHSRGQKMFLPCPGTYRVRLLDNEAGCY